MSAEPTAPEQVDVLAVLDAVLADLGFIARRGEATMRHDGAHHTAVKEARAAIVELCDAATDYMHVIECAYTHDHVVKATARLRLARDRVRRT